MIRDDIKAALITAMKGGDKAGTATLRLIQSSLKNRDIELRGTAAPADDDVTVTEVLQKMIKQRRELVRSTSRAAARSSPTSRRRRSRSSRASCRAR